MHNPTPHCEVCDHRIINGVACDGPTIECPFAESARQDQCPQYPDSSLELIAQSGADEYDAIRGLS